ncbi:hypothetical protein [Paenibacillus sp. OAE614]|uniref:hypothetical protein n=1 Tax=Paenibacillus sp. OAE614 TaxID=2663804 RepID=UPI00178A08CE
MKLKKFIPILTIVGLSILPMNAFAAQDQSTSFDDADQAKIQMMVDNGLSQSAAEHIRKVGKILDKLQKSGQVVDLVNNEVVINSPDNKSAVPGISKEDEDFIKNTFQEELTKTHVSHDKKVSDLQENIKNYPGRSEYRIDYPDGSFIEASAKLERTDNIKYEKVSTNGNYHYANEVEVGSGVSYPGDGTYNHTYTMNESDNKQYWDNVQIGINYTVSNGQHHVHINDYGPDQHSDGVVFVSNSGAGVSVADTDYNGDPTTWCAAYNQVTFNVSGNVSVTLFGVFSIGINGGHTWTQTAITRESLVSQHDYAAHS